ncbi:MAG: hypothetical protein QM739_18145 [Propionivibrio sp.]
MKHVLLAAAATALLVGSVQAAPMRCPAVEFGELQTYSTKELVDLYMTYSSTSMAISTSNMAEFKNCDDQMKRIYRIAVQRPDNKTFKKKEEVAQ